MRMQVILDSLFARPSSAPIGGGKKEEFRDWTRNVQVLDGETKSLYTVSLWLIVIFVLNVTFQIVQRQKLLF